MHFCVRVLSTQYIQYSGHVPVCWLRSTLQGRPSSARPAGYTALWRLLTKKSNDFNDWHSWSASLFRLILSQAHGRLSMLGVFCCCQIFHLPVNASLCIGSGSVSCGLRSQYARRIVRFRHSIRAANDGCHLSLELGNGKLFALCWHLAERWTKAKLEIWSQKPRYFAAAVAVHCRWRGLQVREGDNKSGRG